MLTAAQLTTLKAAIAADATLAAWAATGRMAQELADYFNVVASPTFYVWRSFVTAEEWRDGILNNGGASGIDNMLDGKRTAFLWAISGGLNPSKAIIRSTLVDYASGQSALQSALLVTARRAATRAEKLLASGTGSAASPATMAFEGALLYSDVESALQA